VILRKAENK